MGSMQAPPGALLLPTLSRLYGAPFTPALRDVPATSSEGLLCRLNKFTELRPLALSLLVGHPARLGPTVKRVLAPRPEADGCKPAEC